MAGLNLNDAHVYISVNINPVTLIPEVCYTSQVSNVISLHNNYQPTYSYNHFTVSLHWYSVMITG